MAAGDNTIEEGVVKIRPDLTGFRRQLDADLTKALAGVKASVAVKLVADGTGFNIAAKKALDAQALLRNAPTYKVRLVASAKGFLDSARTELDELSTRTRQPTYKVRLVASAAGFKTSANKALKASGAGKIALSGSSRSERSATTKATQDAGDDAEEAATTALQKIEGTVRRFAPQINKELSKALNTEFLIPKDAEPLSKALTRAQNERAVIARAEGQAYDEEATKQFLSTAQKLDHLHAQAFAHDNKQVSSHTDEITRLHDIANRRNDALDKAATATAEREAEKRVRAAEQEATRTAAARKKATQVPNLIAFGQEGIKPVNLLYTGLLALSPALFAVASSGVQAATSLAGLGAAAYGSVLGVTALTISFKGLTDILALRKSVQAEQTTAAANLATTTDTLTNAIDAQKDARDALADSQRAELKTQLAINDARKEAAKDLVDLRQKVRDLQNQERSDRLSIAEAKQRQKEAALDLFATPLEKQRTDQDVRDAQTRFADTRLDRRESQTQLRTDTRKGVNGSDKVKSAVEAHNDAVRARQKAQRAVTKSAQAVTTAKTGPKVSSAQANLDAQLKQHSAAFRELYGWIDKNDGVLKTFRNKIEQATLPGFTTFLQDISTKSKDGSSTLALLVDGVATIGGKISGTVADFGEFAKSPFFKGKLRTLNKETGKSFGILGGALVKLATPITDIVVAAAPLFTTFAKAMDHFADWLTRVITEADKSGELAKWFKDAGDEAGVWFDIGKNVLALIGNLFKASLPTGNSLVERFSVFTKGLADKSGSDSGQKRIRDFFEIFKNLDYGKISSFVTSSISLFAAYRATSFVFKSPAAAAISALTLLMTAHPGTTVAFLQAMTDFLNVGIRFIAENPNAAATVLAIFAAAKAAKALDIGIKLPGVDNLKNYLTGKFKVLDTLFGGAKTSVMNVQAGVVNVNGGITGGGSTPLATGAGSAEKTAAAAAATAEKSGFKKFLSGLGSGLLGIVKGEFVFVPLPDNATKTQSAQDIIKDAEQRRSGSPAAKPQAAADSGNENPKVRNGGSNGPTFGPKFDLLKSLAANEDSSYVKARVAVSGMGTANLDSASWANSNVDIKKYIDDRKKHVQAYVDYIRGKDGPAAAAKVQTDEDNKSKSALSQMLQQYGWTGNAAENYAKKVFLGSGKTDSLTTSVDKAKAAGDKLDGSISSLNTSLDKTTGKRVITLTMADGSTAVFKTLQEALTYQRALQTGLSLYAAGQAVKRDQEATKNGVYGHAATGGYITGAGTWTSDSIPTMLSAGEYVVPAKRVKQYGLGAMESIRRGDLAEPARYAAGGSVAPQTWKLPVDISKTLIPSVSADTGGTGGDAGQLANARIIVDVGTKLGANPDQILSAIETALVESTLHNLPGGDRDSVGLFQQRPSQGWGNPKDLQNPTIAASKFYRALFKVWDPKKYTPGQAAQAVQRSGFPLKYDQAQGQARSVIAELAGQTGAGAGTKATLIAFGHWLQSQGYAVTENPAFGGVGGHGGTSLHYSGNAIDVNHGAGTSKKEQGYLTNVLADAHAAGLRTIFMYPGHYNHLHVDTSKGPSLGRTIGDTNGVQFHAYDKGGDLPPGYTMAFNGTGRTETVRTAKQEADLSPAGGVSNVRLDRRDIVAIAQTLAAVMGGNTITMDGRKVAEQTNRYTYLPAGVQ